MTLAIDKMDGGALVKQHIVNICQEDWGNAVLATEGSPNSSNKTVLFSYKDEWQMHSDAFKRRLAFGFIVIILA